MLKFLFVKHSFEFIRRERALKERCRLSYRRHTHERHSVFSVGFAFSFVDWAGPRLRTSPSRHIGHNQWECD